MRSQSSEDPRKTATPPAWPGAMVLRAISSRVVLSRAVLSLGILIAGCEQQEAEAEPTPVTQGSSNEDSNNEDSPDLTGTRVEVAVIEPSPQTLTLQAPGEVEGERDAFLSSSLGGYIENVHVGEGDEVQAGAVLARVDSQSHSTRLLRAQVERDAAKRELERAKALQGTIPQAEIDAARDRLETAKASLRELQVNVQRSIIKAPFSGVVVEVNAEVGEVANPGAPLIRLVRLDPVHVTVALSDRDIALAKEGMPAHVQLDARSGIFEGKVLRLSQAAELKTRSFEATIEVDNPDQLLLPGMIAKVSLQAKSGQKDGEPEIMISQDWLVTDPDGVGVFVAKDGIAQWRPVELGPVVRRQVTVDKGLNRGDALIIVGHRTLSDGDPIIIHRKGRCCRNGRPVFGDELSE